jgi:hypothetical protein
MPAPPAPSRFVNFTHNAKSVSIRCTSIATVVETDIPNVTNVILIGGIAIAVDESHANAKVAIDAALAALDAV